ncbi:hypothetical protein WDW89_26565, partial [Deltaproteobacteria bacterium TL4]
MASEFVNKLKTIDKIDSFWKLVTLYDQDFITEIAQLTSDEIKDLSTHFAGKLEEIHQTIDFAVKLVQGKFQSIDDIITNPELPLQLFKTLSTDAVGVILTQLEGPQYEQARLAIKTTQMITKFEDWNTFQSEFLNQLNQTPKDFWAKLDSLPNKLMKGFETFLCQEFEKQGLGAEGKKIGQVLNAMDMLSDVKRLPELVNDPDALQVTIKTLHTQLPNVYQKFEDEAKKKANALKAGVGDQLVTMIQEVRDHEINNWDAFFLKHSRIFLNDQIPGLDLEAVKKALAFPLLMSEMLNNPEEAGREILAQVLKQKFEIKGEITADTFKDATKTRAVVMKMMLVQMQTTQNKLNYLKQEHIAILNEVVQFIEDGKTTEAKESIKNLFEGEIKDIAINKGLKEAVKFVPGLAPFVPFLESVKEGAQPEAVITGVLNTMVIMAFNPTAALLLSPAIGIAADEVGKWFRVMAHELSDEKELLHALIPKQEVEAIKAASNEDIRPEDINAPTTDYDVIQTEFIGEVRKITVRNPVNGRVILVDEKTQTLHIESVIDGTVHQLSGLDP